MDFKQLLMFQLASPTHSSKSGGGSNHMSDTLWAFASLQMVELLAANLTSSIKCIQNATQTYFAKRAERLTSKISAPQTAHIEFRRNYKCSEENQMYIDSILHYISQLNTVIRLQRRRVFIVNSYNEFDISQDIKGRMLNVTEQTDTITEIRFELYSYTWSLSKLREWVDQVYSTYMTDIQTGFGKNKYYFNHKSCKRGTTNLMFEMNSFITNKSLSNLFGTHIEKVAQRINKFQTNVQWYENKGIPHTLGLLLYGQPGCGKTSLIKAIAKDTGRHIVNIKLTDDITLTQLSNLFYSEKLQVPDENDSSTKYISVPINQRIYVMEDVDCLTTLLHQRTEIEEKRTLINQQETKSAETQRMIDILGEDRWQAQQQSINFSTGKTEKITLSDILNILDGVLETPGRIMILTSNFPDKLDKALMRPGRVDLIVEFKLCDAEHLKQMFTHFYEQPVDKLNFMAIESCFTPAYVQEILLQYDDNPTDAFEYLHTQKRNRIPDTNE